TVVGWFFARILRVGVEHALGWGDGLWQPLHAREPRDLFVDVAGAVVFDGFAESGANSLALSAPLPRRGALDLRDHSIVEVREDGLIHDRRVRLFHSPHDFRQAAYYADFRTHEVQEAFELRPPRFSCSSFLTWVG